MNNYYVYTHATIDGRVFYVGKGKGKRSVDIRNRNKYWWHIVKKYKAYVTNIVRHGLTCTESLNLEIALIAKLKKKHKLCNLTDGGQGTSGRIISNETRLKMSKSSKGNKRSVGRVLSEETKKKIGDAHRGKKRKPFTLETRLKMSTATKGKNNPMYGKKTSKETKLKLSIAGKGRRHTEESKLKMSRIAKALWVKRKGENNN